MAVPEGDNPTSNSTDRSSPIVPGASIHSALYSTPSIALEGDLISFLSYVKSQNIPILPVSLPDVRSCLGRGASFFVNSAEMPETYVNRATGEVFPKGLVVAFKRTVVNKYMTDIIANRIDVIFNEVITMHHPPLLAHPNIVRLLGIGFENESSDHSERAMPVLITEYAELGDLAGVLEAAKRDGRPFGFEEKLSLCIDVAHGLEVLHACNIVHGDIKCENVLIFEKDPQSEDYEQRKTPLIGKLTDFGFSHHPIRGSPLWQPPECSHSADSKVESAKYTDVYSFGMLLWRVMLDGEPFKSLGEFNGKTAKDRRRQRFDALSRLKKEDLIVEHACNSLEDSGKFSPSQLETLCEVIKVTLTKEPVSRELDMGRIIGLLMPKDWHQRRHPVNPSRISADANTQLLDIEKHYAEFQNTCNPVKAQIAKGFRVYAGALRGQNERDSAAAFQLAICYASGFGVPFQPLECLKWLELAATGGSYRARQALPQVAKAFDLQVEGYVDTSIARAPDPPAPHPGKEKQLSGNFAKTGISGNEESLGPDGGDTGENWTLLSAARACKYDILEYLLSTGAKPDASEDGITPLHFLSSWRIGRAEKLGRKLIQAGADVNAKAKRGTSVGGTPIMWSVYGDCPEHSAILIKLGANPLADVDGIDAFSLAAKLHLAPHLRFLLRTVRPAQLFDRMGHLLEVAASGQGRFARIVKHGSQWKTAPVETFRVLQNFYSLYPEAYPFTHLLPHTLKPEDDQTNADIQESFINEVPRAMKSSLNSGYGRMNVDIQISFINEAQIDAAGLSELLGESVVSFNRELFNFLLDRGVPVTGRFEGGKTLLHLCAQIPDHKAAATAFAPRLLALGVSIEARDDAGLTPFVNAAIQRKWELADLFLARGADPLTTNSEGYTALGVCIQTINCGTLKYLLKYCAAHSAFQNSFLVNPQRQISALQAAANLPHPRAHGMKSEAARVFLLTLRKVDSQEHIDFRSDGILPHATALEIAAANANVLAVASLVKKDARPDVAGRAVQLAKSRLATAPDQRLRLERCIFILENWAVDRERTRRLAARWNRVYMTGTVAYHLNADDDDEEEDEAHADSSWERLF